MCASNGWWARLVEWFVIHYLTRHFPGRYRVIPRLDGVPLLRQFLVLRLGPVKRPWVEVFLHSFINGEGREWFHRHRWGRMISLVLSGRFCEERFPGQLYRIHRAPSVYMMDQATIHRLDWAAERTWSLFVGLDNDLEWDYWRRPTPEALQRTRWQDMIPPEKRIKSL